MSKPFHFKKFSVLHDQCAMKVGTDSVLLGAWSSLKHAPKSILDIGAGTGVLALIMAQRSSAEIIDALEGEIFIADDSLGWVYQFWQSEAKAAIKALEALVDAVPAVKKKRKRR